MNFDPAFWALQCVAMLLTCFLIPKLTIDGPLSALITVIALSFINSHLWSSALFFKIPDSFAYEAILLFLTNGVLFFVVVKILPGISVEGVFPALIAPVVFSLLSLLISKYKDQVDWAWLWEQTMHYFNLAKEYFLKDKQHSFLEQNKFLSEPINRFA